MINNEKTARSAGIWWLLFILACPISYLVIDGKLLVPGDAATTINNINSNMALFWIGVVAFLAGYVCFILLAKALFKLFAPVDSKLTKLMMALVIVGTALVLTGKVAEIIATNMSNIDDAARLLNLRTNIEMVGELFWGLWLIPLVVLILKSNLIPKIVGGALLTAAVYHLVSFGVFFITGTDVSTNPALAILGLGEFIMILWLLIKGIRATKGNQ
jgi:hypothetical protein